MRLPNEHDLKLTSFLLLLLLFFAMSATEARGAPVWVHFDQDVYVVSGPGEAIDVQVLIDGNPASMVDDPVRGGLYSAALRVDFDDTKAAFTGVSDISVVPELDFFGFQAGSFINNTTNFAGVKGNIDQNASPLVPYTEPLLATFHITNLATGPDSYPLTLDFFRTLGANEQMFLDGNGGVLDPEVQFGTALVIVVPEPCTCVALLAGLGGVLLAQRRRCRKR